MENMQPFFLSQKCFCARVDWLLSPPRDTVMLKRSVCHARCAWWQEEAQEARCAVSNSLSLPPVPVGFGGEPGYVYLESGTNCRQVGREIVPIDADKTATCVVVVGHFRTGSHEWSHTYCPTHRAWGEFANRAYTLAGKYYLARVVGCPGCAADQAALDRWVPWGTYQK